MLVNILYTALHEFKYQGEIANICKFFFIVFKLFDLNETFTNKMLLIFHSVSKIFKYII